MTSNFNPRSCSLLLLEAIQIVLTQHRSLGPSLFEQQNRLLTVFMSSYRSADCALRALHILFGFTKDRPYAEAAIQVGLVRELLKLAKLHSSNAVAVQLAYGVSCFLCFCFPRCILLTRHSCSSLVFALTAQHCGAFAEHCIGWPHSGIGVLCRQSRAGTCATSRRPLYWRIGADGACNSSQQ